MKLLGSRTTAAGRRNRLDARATLVGKFETATRTTQGKSAWASREFEVRSLRAAKMFGWLEKINHSQLHCSRLACWVELCRAYRSLSVLKCGPPLQWIIGWWKNISQRAETTRSGPGQGTESCRCYSQSKTTLYRQNVWSVFAFVLPSRYHNRFYS